MNWIGSGASASRRRTIGEEGVVSGGVYNEGERRVS